MERIWRAVFGSNLARKPASCFVADFGGVFLAGFVMGFVYARLLGIVKFAGEAGRDLDFY